MTTNYNAAMDIAQADYDAALEAAMDAGMNEDVEAFEIYCAAMDAAS